MDLLEPVRDLRILSYKGPRPAVLLKVVLPSIQRIMELDSPKLAEMELRWDSTDGSFQGKWAAFKSYDKWTHMWIWVNVWGRQDLQTKEGNARIKVKGWLITEFDYYHALQQGFWWTFSYLFYNRTRRKLFDQSKDYYFRVIDMIKQNLNILPEDTTISTGTPSIGERER
ncbi:Uncharacterised protein [uncultured archaeon]|nr:Uncharacterised protein [uncultured archaeon]